jgi:hypothetical protein
MSRDDDTPTHLPAPDDVAEGAEKARARAFGDLVDKVMAGRPPAAVPAEERALLEVATVIRAATRPVELGTARAASLVEAALATAIERKGGGRAGGLSDPSLSVPGVVPIGRSRARRAAPWILAGVTSVVAAAAVVALLVRPAPRGEAGGAVATTTPPAAHLRSRPADPLIGVIARAPGLDDASGATVLRIDTIYADRLSGFRERTLSGAVRTHGSGGKGGRP